VIDIVKKQACTDSLASVLFRTRDWRLGLKGRYPDDPRLGKAAETLDRLAGETDQLSDEAWQVLAEYYNWSSAYWANSVSHAARRVEYSREVRTFSGFVNQLIAILRVQA
jgi:predicted aminopeptidase